MRVLVTGGAGFIGSNLTDRLARSGCTVVVLDNLSRASVIHNLRWLKERHGERVCFVEGDVRDAELVREVVRGAEQVYHLAAQVAVTTSLESPSLDFEVNARGTLNLLDAARACPAPPSLVFTSTNKVYGALEDVSLRAGRSRYVPTDPLLAVYGVDERRGLDFHSPYGCSKGAADQYMLDHARSFGLRTVVLRMSCIYGPRQFGTEDQGWVAHFVRRALGERPIVLYGDGRQVRDLLFVDDLVDALLLAQEHAHRLRGRAFNLGGGAARTLSLRELLGQIEQLTGLRPQLSHEDWRVGDQRWFVADTRAFQAATGWSPSVSVGEGLRRLCQWLATLPRDNPEAVEASA